MTDSVETLRRNAMIIEEVGCGSDIGRKVASINMREAAAEIERLRAALQFIADEPRGTLECVEIARAALSSTDSNPTGNIEDGA